MATWDSDRLTQRFQLVRVLEGASGSLICGTCWVSQRDTDVVPGAPLPDAVLVTAVGTFWYLEATTGAATQPRSLSGTDR